MGTVFFITHPEVAVDPDLPVPRWHLSQAGISRMRHFAGSPAVANVTCIRSSGETKAVEAAGILAEARGLRPTMDEEFGENDRSATGFLPPAEFERAADAFFARPEASARGWERAVDAQARVLRAFERALADHGSGDLAILAHGGVGTLLLCRLLGQPITRANDQPFQGHFWSASIADRRILHSWRSIAPRG